MLVYELLVVLILTISVNSHLDFPFLLVMNTQAVPDTMLPLRLDYASLVNDSAYSKCFILFRMSHSLELPSLIELPNPNLKTPKI